MEAREITGKMIAEARDEWLASEEGSRMRKGSADGQYLENRLVLAFEAGINAAVAMMKERPTDDPK